jgi:hypothetical protein
MPDTNLSHDHQPAGIENSAQDLESSEDLANEKHALGEIYRDSGVLKEMTNHQPLHK